MTPEQAIARREQRIDALIEEVEAGRFLTQNDWRKIAQLNILDLMSVEQGAARQILESEREADGVDNDRPGI